MTTMTSTEQLILEMINRARMDPAGEAAKLGIDLNAYIAPGTISAAPKQVLAGSNALRTIAESHTNGMIAHQTLESGGNPHDTSWDGTADSRIVGAGYTAWRAENVWGVAGPTDEATLATQIENSLFKDDPSQNRGDPAGHRLNILSDNVTEVGIGTARGTVFGIANGMEVTEDFGKAANARPFLTGVAYNDANHSNFYDLNEGVAGVTATVTTTTGAAVGGDVTGSGGGYSVAGPGGLLNITFTGTGVATGGVTATVDTGALNAKVDLVNGNTIYTNVNTTLGAGATDLHLLGISSINATGNALANTFYGNIGNNIFDGGAGNDTVVYSGNKASYGITQNSDGSITLTGPDGTDKLISIENIKFADQTWSATPPNTGTITINDVQITEGNSGTQVATFTVTRSGGTAAFDVNFATVDGTATTADGDYVANSNTLHFGANVNTQTISVVINGDTKVEANETFNVNLSGATNGATISDNQGTGIIINDDAAPVAGSISINDVQITEGNSGTQVATFTVTRTGGTAAFDVNFATADGTATTADGDYVTNSNTLHFGANVNTQTVSVVINGDTKVEANETFAVNLSGATNGATISDSQGIGTIINDDAAAVAGSISINDVQITEGNSGTQVATFTVTRTGGTAAFDVNYATVDGTATTADGDYLAAANTLHFGANVNTQTVSVVINGDTKVEANETFGVDLSGATNGATVSDSHGVGTIVNDDVAAVAGSISINDVQITEGNNGTQVATFTVTRAGGTAAFDVHYATADGTATTADGDYVGTSNTLHFGANVNTQTVSVTINGDTKVEANETFGVDLSGATNGATISDSHGVGTIINDDTATGAPKVPDDFNGDGMSDILWRADDGTVATWDMNDHRESAFSFGAVGNQWHIADTGDFNGDGKADVLWRADDGTVATWDMNDHQESAFSFGVVGNQWHIAGTGDFNGDGKTDILWRADDGTVATWDMNDHQVSAFSFGAVGNQWHIAGTGDFNGDGKTDILWRADDGTVLTWDMNDHQLSAFSFGVVGNQWHVAGTGDFNGDGKTDILWRADDGTVLTWDMNDHQASAFSFGAVGNQWHIADTGDFNGDGKTDILWRADDGTVATWDMNDHQESAFSFGAVGNQWHIVA